MSAPVETTALTRPLSIRSQMISPCLATVMAPASVMTTKHFWSRAMASSTSTASPSWRPVKAVSAMPRTKALMVFARDRSSGNTGESLSFTGSCSLRSMPAPLCFFFNPHLRFCGRVFKPTLKITGLRFIRQSREGEKHFTAKDATGAKEEQNQNPTAESAENAERRRKSKSIDIFLWFCSSFAPFASFAVITPRRNRFCLLSL